MCQINSSDKDIVVKIKTPSIIAFSCHFYHVVVVTCWGVFNWDTATITMNRINLFLYSPDKVTEIDVGVAIEFFVYIPILLYNEKLNVLYFSLYILRVIQSRRMRRSGYLVRMGERRGVYRILVRKP